MKYEPTSKPEQTEIALLMMPFSTQHTETNWELVQLVSDTLSTLSESDQDAIHGIYYARKTYQELASDLGIKAKSHAWRKADSALKNLKKALLKNEQFIEMMGEQYGI
jgi:DNA-directed RNA polymerase specialized sigma subunit